MVPNTHTYLCDVILMQNFIDNWNWNPDKQTLQSSEDEFGHILVESQMC